MKIKGGKFKFGDKDGKENEKPAVPIKMKSFYLSETEVSNMQFQAFVDATSYVTDAEKSGRSAVFENEEWNDVVTASWKNPHTIGEDEDWGIQPVVHVSQNDAKAYCNWIGGRLPSEIELEYAMVKGGQQKMNIWSGDFPKQLDEKDGHKYTAPVKEGEKNKLGLFHLKGNVWEWTNDTYHYEIHDKLAFKKKRSQKSYTGQGYVLGKGLAPNENKVIKGGSFLCHKSYCSGYRPEARQFANKDESFFHIGFRVAKDFK